PHKRAYEAAVTQLYRKKSEIDLDDVLNQFKNLNLDETLNHDPQRSFQESLQQVGVSTPMIDHSVYLDAFLEIINIQKLLYHECSEIADAFKTIRLLRNHEKIEEEIRPKWLAFGSMILKSANAHLELILERAESTAHKRRYIIASLD